jgi:hypothetical protein
MIQWRRLRRVAYAVLILVAASPFEGVARPNHCKWLPITFDRNSSLIMAGNFAVTLKGPDAESAPQIWEGPIEIRDRKSDKTCTLSIKGLIDRPLSATNDHLLVLVTSSGSNFILTTLDLLHCTVANVTRKLTGPITFQNGQVLAHGQPVPDFACGAVSPK